MIRRRPSMPVRAVRVDDETWRAAHEAAVERNEFLHEEIRAFLKRYALREAMRRAVLSEKATATHPDARTAPARPDAATGGTPTDTEEQP